MIKNNLISKPNDHWMVPYIVLYIDQKSLRSLHQTLWDFLKLLASLHHYKKTWLECLKCDPLFIRSHVLIWNQRWQPTSDIVQHRTPWKTSLYCSHDLYNQETNNNCPWLIYFSPDPYEMRSFCGGPTSHTLFVTTNKAFELVVSEKNISKISANQRQEFCLQCKEEGAIHIVLSHI